MRRGEKGKLRGERERKRELIWRNETGKKREIKEGIDSPDQQEKKRRKEFKYGFTYTFSWLTRTFLLTSTLCLPQTPRLGQWWKWLVLFPQWQSLCLLPWRIQWGWVVLCGLRPGTPERGFQRLSLPTNAACWCQSYSPCQTGRRAQHTSPGHEWNHMTLTSKYRFLAKKVIMTLTSKSSCLQYRYNISFY